VALPGIRIKSQSLPSGKCSGLCDRLRITLMPDVPWCNRTTPIHLNAAFTAVAGDTIGVNVSFARRDALCASDYLSYATTVPVSPLTTLGLSRSLDSAFAPICGKQAIAGDNNLALAV
jgi:hypothetical protein